jgi:hypothetical protein
VSPSISASRAVTCSPMVLVHGPTPSQLRAVANVSSTTTSALVPAAALRDKRDIKIDGWNAAGAVVNPTQKYAGSRPNEDMFANAKAQAWWALRDRFLEAFKASKGEAYDRNAIISLSPAIEELRELKSELSQVTYVYNAAGKVLVNKAPDGHSSPNRADSVMIAFAPVKRTGVQLIGIFGSDGSVWEPDPKIWG